MECSLCAQGFAPYVPTNHLFWLPITSFEPFQKQISGGMGLFSWRQWLPSGVLSRSVPLSFSLTLSMSLSFSISLLFLSISLSFSISLLSLSESLVLSRLFTAAGLRNSYTLWDFPLLVGFDFLVSPVPESREEVSSMFGCFF